MVARLAALAATVVAAGTLAVLPASPASAATQSIYFSQSPASYVDVGYSTHFVWNGTTSFFGPGITGCFANFTDGNNFTYSFGGSYSSDSCNYTRYMYNIGYIYIQVGFTLSDGSTMTTGASVNVQAIPPHSASGPASTTTVTSGDTAAFSVKHRRQSLAVRAVAAVDQRLFLQQYPRRHPVVVHDAADDVRGQREVLPRCLHQQPAAP